MKGQNMGVYLNPGSEKFEISRKSKIYIDKSGIIVKLNSFYNTEDRFVCVSRPRRFGKSMTANMISAYYDRTVDGNNIFSDLIVADKDDSFRNINSADVIFINMQEFLSRSGDIYELLDNLKKSVLWDIFKEYNKVNYFNKSDFARVFEDVYAYSGIKFVIIIDEWDCILREYKDDKDAQKIYLDFLRDFLKDKAYIGLAYMTGILPIKKYGTHSALNMFSEYSMLNAVPLDSYMGFTEDEVNELCSEYGMMLEEVQSWYNGYHLKNVGDIYSPRSVVQCMKTGIFDDYWNKTESFEALKVYIDMNYKGLKDAVIELMAGGKVRINTGTFTNDMTTFSGYEDVLTLLVHLGYLGYDFDTKQVFIPNREVMMEFASAISASDDWTIIADSIKKSDQLLMDTWNMDEMAVAKAIEDAHFETSILQYNNENSLACVISLAYYAARQYYTVVREYPSGKGFADLVFIPRPKYSDKPALIVELKNNKTAEGALQQIKDKKYSYGLDEYKDNTLLVGLNYDMATKEHQCFIERL